MIPSSVPNPKVVKCLLFISFVPIREDFRAKKLKRKGKKKATAFEVLLSLVHAYYMKCPHLKH